MTSLTTPCDICIKTMVATRLAAVSGSDCAVMSGGDIGPLGKVLKTKQITMFELKIENYTDDGLYNVSTKL